MAATAGADSLECHGGAECKQDLEVADVDHVSGRSSSDGEWLGGEYF